jgi:hypothetical protein
VAALAGLRDVLAARPGGLRFFSPNHTRFGDQLWARLPSAATHEESLLPVRQQRLLDHFGLYAVELWGRPPNVAAWIASRGWFDELGVAAVEAHATDAAELVSAGFAPLSGIAAEEGFVWLLNPTARPRARIVERAEWAETRDAALELVKSGVFDPDERVVLDPGDGPPILPPALPGARFAPPGAGERKVEIVRDLPEAVDLVADAPQDAVLVLADSYDSGWHARVNGNPAAVFAADAAFRAVLIPKGRSAIELRYRPRAFSVGLVLGLLGLGLTGILALRVGRRRGELHG